MNIVQGADRRKEVIRPYCMATNEAGCQTPFDILKEKSRVSRMRKTESVKNPDEAPLYM